MAEYFSVEEIIIFLIAASVIIQLFMAAGILRIRKECAEISKTLKPYIKSLWRENKNSAREEKRRDYEQLPQQITPQKAQQPQQENQVKKEFPKGIEFTPEEEKIIREVLQEYML